MRDKQGGQSCDREGKSQGPACTGPRACDYNTQGEFQNLLNCHKGTACLPCRVRIAVRPYTQGPAGGTPTSAQEGSTGLAATLGPERAGGHLGQALQTPQPPEIPTGFGSLKGSFIC